MCTSWPWKLEAATQFGSFVCWSVDCFSLKAAELSQYNVCISERFAKELLEKLSSSHLMFCRSMCDALLTLILEENKHLRQLCSHIGVSTSSLSSSSVLNYFVVFTFWQLLICRPHLNLSSFFPTLSWQRCWNVEIVLALAYAGKIISPSLRHLYTCT